MPLAEQYKCQYAAELLKIHNKLSKAQTNLQGVFENIVQIPEQLLAPNSAFLEICSLLNYNNVSVRVLSNENIPTDYHVQGLLK